jgi:hypothetical protein
MKSSAITRLLAFAFVMLTGTACMSQLVVPPEAEVDGVHFALELEKEKVSRWEILRGQFVVTNQTEETVTFQFMSGCQTGHRLEKGGKAVLTRPLGCYAALTSMTVPAGETVVRELHIDFDLGPDSNHRKIDPGTYVLKAFLMDYNSPVLSRPVIVVE